jgi:hypothetical protein
MKKGKTLQELAIELQRQKTAKRDFVVSAESMHMEEGAGLFSLCRNLESGMREVEPFEMTDLFHRQLGTCLNIPAVYYDRMRGAYPEMLTANVNGWLGKQDSRHTIRTLDGKARAFLSARYRRIDNDEIAEAVLPAILEMPDAKIESCEVTDDKMYIKVVNPRLEAEVFPGDNVQAGIVISNSEVGLGAVSVMPLIFRLVCSNGMIVNALGQRKYHVGRKNDEENWEIYSDETKQADDRALLLKVADTVRSAIDEVKFARIVDKYREAADAKITARPPELVELTAKNYGFNESEQYGILQHLISGGDLSLYGLSNAVTRTANDCGSYDRATALETAGWQIITMPPKLWKELNASD